MHTQHEQHAVSLSAWEKRHLEHPPYHNNKHSPHLNADEDGRSFGTLADQRHYRTQNPESGPNAFPPQYSSSHYPHVPYNHTQYVQTPPAADPRYPPQHGPRTSDSTSRSGSVISTSQYIHKMTEAQAFATPRDPPTPPYSNVSSATSSPPLEAPPFNAATAASFPGTMSTRETKPSRSSMHSCSSSKREHQRKDSKTDGSEPSSKFGSRLKSTFKDMFKRDPIDESEYERIDRRHWADDD